MQARLKDLSWKTQYSGIYTAPNRKTPQGPPSGVLARQTKRGAARHAQHSANAVRGVSFRFNSEPRPRKIAGMLIEHMRKRLAADTKFIEPCLPSRADKPPSGSNWIHEIKHDGYRLMTRRDLIGIRLIADTNGPPTFSRYCGPLRRGFISSRLPIGILGRPPRCAH